MKCTWECFDLERNFKNNGSLKFCFFMKHALWLSTNYSNKCFIYFLFAGKGKSQTTIIWNTCSFCYSNHSSHCYIKQQRWFVFVLLWSSILFCGLHCPTLLLASNMSKAIEEGARKQKQLRQRMTSTISLPDHWTSIEIARNIGTALVMEWSYSVILIFFFFLACRKQTNVWFALFFYCHDNMFEILKLLFIMCFLCVFTNSSSSKSNNDDNNDKSTLNKEHGSWVLSLQS